MVGRSGAGRYWRVAGAGGLAMSALGLDILAYLLMGAIGLFGAMLGVRDFLRAFVTIAVVSIALNAAFQSRDSGVGVPRDGEAMPERTSQDISTECHRTDERKITCVITKSR